MVFPLTAGPYPMLRSSAVILTCFRNFGKTECAAHGDNKTPAGLLLPTSRSGRLPSAVFGFEGGCQSSVTSHRVTLLGVFLLSTFCIAESLGPAADLSSGLRLEQVNARKLNALSQLFTRKLWTLALRHACCLKCQSM